MKNISKSILTNRPDILKRRQWIKENLENFIDKTDNKKCFSRKEKERFEKIRKEF